MKPGKVTQEGLAWPAAASQRTRLNLPCQKQEEEDGEGLLAGQDAGWQCAGQPQMQK